jgi:hypothetical protein
MKAGSDDPTPRLSIGFYSISDRPELSDVTQRRLREYCERHGYALTLHSSTLDPSRHAAWSKLTLLRSALRREAHDLYVWIDDDIYLTSLETRLEDLLAPYPFAHLLVSRDVAAEHPMNSGFLVMRRTVAVERLLRDAYLLAQPLGLRWQSPWEQGALAHLYHAECSREAEEARDGAARDGEVDQKCGLEAGEEGEDEGEEGQQEEDGDGDEDEEAAGEHGGLQPAAARRLFTLVPHTVLQSFHRDHDVPEQ